MEIQRQADQWDLPHREAAYDNYQPSREELREMLAGPRIHTGMLNTRTAGEVTDAFKDFGDAAHNVGDALSSAEPGDSGEVPNHLPGDAVLDLLDPLTGGLSSAIKDARNYRHAYPQTDPTVKQNQFALQTQKSLQPKGINRANPSLKQNDLAVKSQKTLLPKKPKAIPDDLGQDKSFAPAIQPPPKVQQYKASSLTRLADTAEDDARKRGLQPTGGPAYNPPPVNQNPPAAPQAPPPQNLGNTPEQGSTGVPTKTNDLAKAGNPLNTTGSPPTSTATPPSTGEHSQNSQSNNSTEHGNKKEEPSPAKPSSPSSSPSSPGSSSMGMNPGEIAGLLGEIAGPIGGAISSFVPGLAGLGGALTGMIPSIGGLFHASVNRCPGSGQYPLEEHRRIEGLYRCGACQKWSAVDVRAKMMEHIATDGTGAASSPSVAAPGTGGLAGGGNPAGLAGEANSAGALNNAPQVAPIPPVAPTAGSAPLNANDLFSQAAGANFVAPPRV